MKLKPCFRWAAIAAFGLGIGMATQPAIAAASFDQQELEQSRMIAIAAPVANGAFHQLLIVEQISNARACWQEVPGTPTKVEPLLVNFDFTGICGRSVDSNGYSVRVGGEDLGWRYSLRVQKRQNDLVLMAVPALNANATPIEIGRTNGLSNGFSRFALNPGWRMTKRVYQGKPLGHIYLTNNLTLAQLIQTPSTLPPIATTPKPTPSTPPAPRPVPPVPGGTLPKPPVVTNPPTAPKPPVATNPAPKPKPGDVFVPVEYEFTSPDAPNNANLPSVPVSPTPKPNTGNSGTGNLPTLPPANLSYRVIVMASTPSQQSVLKKVVPGAFRTTYNGRSVMQAGAFSDRGKADDLLQRLSNENLMAMIVSMN
jgi:N-acetylmuramoyl-L-alanine amidase